MKKHAGFESNVIPPNAVYSLEAAAAAVGVARTGLQNAIREGRLQASRPGQHYVITGDCLLEWVRSPATVKKPSQCDQGVAESA